MIKVNIINDPSGWLSVHNIKTNGILMKFNKDFIECNTLVEKLERFGYKVIKKPTQCMKGIFFDYDEILCKLCVFRKACIADIEKTDTEDEFFIAIKVVNSEGIEEEPLKVFNKSEKENVISYCKYLFEKYPILVRKVEK